MIRPFCLRSESQLVALGDWLSSQAEAWARDWLSGAPWPRVAGVRGSPDEREHAKWTEVWRDPEASERWCAVRLESGQALASALFATGLEALRACAPRVDLAARVTQRAVADLAIRILGATSAPEALEALPRDACAPGSGASSVCVKVRGARVRCLLSAAVVDARLGRAERPSARAQGPLSARAEALDRQRIHARAVAGTAELPLHAVTLLAVGDVVSLDQRMDAPSRLVFPTLGAECAAYLCEQDGHNALLIEVPDSPSAGEPIGSDAAS